MRKTEDQLLEELANARNSIEIGAIYLHYKNPQYRYQIIDVAINESDNEPVVIYRALYGKEITFVRHLNVWLQDVEHEGKIKKRFTKQTRET